MNKFLWMSVVALIVILAERPPKCRGDQLVGGPSVERRANSAVRDMVKTLKPRIYEHLSARHGQIGNLNDPTSSLKPISLRPISYRTQLVNGINYFIKVRTRIGQQRVYYHVKVYESFDGKRTLVAITSPMDKNAELGYF